MPSTKPLIFAAALLCACGADGPATLALNATAGPGMNPAADGSERPLALTVYHLADPAPFLAAPAPALQSDAAATLGPGLLKEEVLILAPGGTAASTIAVEPAATAVGLLAGYRDPSGKTIKQVLSVAPGDSLTVAATVDASGLSLN